MVFQSRKINRFIFLWPILMIDFYIVHVICGVCELGKKAMQKLGQAIL
jgi:hypothetical protein